MGSNRNRTLAIRRRMATHHERYAAAARALSVTADDTSACGTADGEPADLDDAYRFPAVSDQAFKRAQAAMIALRVREYGDAVLAAIRLR